MKKIKIILMSFFVFSLATAYFTAGVQAGPMVNNYEGITYISGGVGVDELQKLQAMAKYYDLKLVFAAKSGNYLADTHVVIKNMQGETVLDTVSDGPWFLAKLPVGQYTITAITAGRAENQKVVIKPAAHTVHYFYWDDNLVCGQSC
jgi:hypothetical protein